MKRAGLTVLAMALSVQLASATSVLVRNGTTQFGEGGYGSPGWSTITGMLDAATGNQVSVVADYLNNGQVQSFDALWVNTGALDGSTNLVAAELANITAFVNSGKRVVLFGENSAWTSWNNNILSLVGGTQGGAVNGVVNTVFVHPLTAGVASINVPAGAAAAVGGTSLFSLNVATLWGSGNVLTFLDSNTLQDSFIGNSNNTQFGQNVANWIAGSQNNVPEPVTLLLTSLGLVGLLVVRRRSS